MGRPVAGGGLVEGPARTGRRVERIGEAKRKALGAGQSDHRRIVGAERQRRGVEAEAFPLGETFQASADGAVGGHTAGDDQAQIGVGLAVGVHGPGRALDQLADDGRLDAGGEVAPIGLALHGRRQASGGGLQPREREVAAGPAKQGPRQGIARRIAALGQALQGWSGRIAEAERGADLVEGLAGGVVDGRAEAAAGADARHLQQLAMAARDQKQQERVGNIGGEAGGDGVTLQVVHGDERFIQRQGHGLAEGERHHHTADEPGASGGGDAGEGGGRNTGLRQGPLNDAVDDLDVGAGRDLRHHAAIGRMLVDLAANDVGDNLGAAVGTQAHDRRGGLVAARFEAKDCKGNGHSHCASGVWWGSRPPMAKQPIRIGARGSKLSVVQAETVRAAIGRALGDDAAAELVLITTTGDRIQDRTLSEIGGKGLFTQEIEAALLDGRIDCAVHSLKDMPTELPAGLIIAAIPAREDPRDAFVSERYASLADLPEGGSLGTASLRRQAQALRARPDLKVMTLRGNVDTRLAKLARGDFDAILVAAAGLKRLGLESHIRSYIDPTETPPAPGQGALAIETRTEDGDAPWLSNLRGHDATLAVAAERGALAALDGSCRTAIGAHAWMWNEGLALVVEALSPDGRVNFWERARLETPDLASAEAFGRDLGTQIKARAGGALST